MTSGGPSPYTGDTVPGGPSAVRDLGNAELRKLSVSPQDNNAYLITCRATGEALLVDAADDAERVLREVDAAGARLTRVVTTHGHGDHHRALVAVVNATGAVTASSREDAADMPLPPDELLAHGDVVAVGDLRLDVIALRGHTPGSLALVLADAEGMLHVLTGDSLFPGGVGNTWGDADRFRSLLADVEARLFDVLPDSTWVYPGHGKDTTLGRERPALPSWRERGW
jgi:glyoxylase-like metal-dependent hydrolase (beta-lactamase superfamily II)